MDRERLTWLFGPDVVDVVAEYDLESEDDRIAVVEEYLALPPDAPSRRARMAIRTVVATQILHDDPPDTWRTVRRLEAEGLDRDRILSQLAMVMTERVEAILGSNTPVDHSEYVAALDALPLPTQNDVAHALVGVARADQGIPADTLIDRVVESVSTRTSKVIRSLVERTLDDLISGPLEYLPADDVLHVPSLVDGRTFTHRFNEFEAEVGHLSVGFDLGAFARFDTVRLEDGTEIDQFSLERAHLGWSGPEGWLSDFEPGDLLAVAATVVAPDRGVEEPVDAVVSITRCDPEPPLRDDVAAAVREAYDEFFAEAGLPVSGEDLALWLCRHRPGLLAQPQAPLEELCAAVGLERRAGEVAHEEAVWRQSLLASRQFQVLHMVSDSHWSRVVTDALDVLDDPDSEVDEIREALHECAEPEALDVLADVLFPHYLEPADEFELGTSDAPGRLFELVHRSLAVAQRPREIATAEYLACVLYERCGLPEEAEQHLTRAVQAMPGLGPAVERMGWYRFDRGDARGAMRWWSLLAERHQAASTVEPFLDHTEGRNLGRNDPCWCGSGRKFKRCHLGSLELPSLPDRVSWLNRKATVWLDHARDEIRQVVIDMAMARATGDPDADPSWLDDVDELDEAFADAFGDPIVMDAALHEGGLFKLFLRERAALLPEDERLLAESWLTRERSVHEVVSASPGAGATVRDLATGDVMEIRERIGSRMMEVGERYCARVVPDGETNQIIGGVFGVRTGNESTVLDLCADRDGYELCAWVGRLHQPPQIVFKPGMIDGMINREAIEDLLANLGEDTDEATSMEVLGREIARQTQTAWLDEQIPALDGLTPREAAADPTRREQVVRLLDEFDRMQRGRPAGDPGGQFSWDIDALRRELDLD